MTSLAKGTTLKANEEAADLHAQLRAAQEELQRMRAVEEEREAERKTERAKLQAAEAKLRAYES